MNKYESIIIVNPNVDEAGLKALEEKFTGFKEGTYMLFNFEANPDSISELERVYRITDDIIKFIVVRKEA